MAFAGRFGHGGIGRSILAPWQKYAEAHLAALADRRDPPAVGFHQPPHHGQPQAGAPGLGSVEGLEDPLQDVGAQLDVIFMFR